MSEETRELFAAEFKKGVGDFLKGLRENAGLSLETVASSLAETRKEKIKLIESGAESLRGLELMELAEIYGADFMEVNLKIQTIAEQAKAKAHSLKH